MKADMEAMKEKMTTMMESMMSIRLQSSKLSCLGYGRSGRRSIGKYG